MSAFTWQTAEAQAKAHGPSFFIYDEARFERNFHELNRAFNARYPATRLAYSYKTNYTPDICRRVDQLGGYAEVVSAMEYDLARRLGVPGHRTVYNGPYKSPESMQSAMLSGAMLNLDSWRDVEIVEAVARQTPQQQFGVAVRCNFPIDGTLQSRFGLDVAGDEFRAAIARIRSFANLRLAGLHCHFPNRQLASFSVRVERMIELAQTWFQEPPDFLNLGGGFFSDMPESLKRRYPNELPSFEDYARVIGDRLAQAFPAEGKRPMLLIEPGTALVADAVEFVCRVVSLKRIRGRQVATVTGSIFNISPTARAVDLPVRILSQAGVGLKGSRAEPYDIAGFTCIENDYLTRSMEGPIEIGDFVVYGNVGSYSIVMKPPFILPNAAILKRDARGGFTLIKQRETNEYIFQNFRGL